VATSTATLRQRELGTELRGLRNERGVTLEEVAAELLCSATKISRLETGGRRPSLRDIRDLCELYQLDKYASAELMSLAREAREPAWWDEYNDLDLGPLIGLEEGATDVSCYSMSYIPGLLQTEEYAQGIIKANAQQIDPYVLDVTSRGKVDVKIIPFKAGAYVAANGYFALLEFEESPDLSPVLFVEGLTGNQYLDRKDDIPRYRETTDYLCVRASSPTDPISLITEDREEYAKERFAQLELSMIIEHLI